MSLAISASETEIRWGDPDVTAIVLTAEDPDGEVNWTVSAGNLQSATGDETEFNPLNRTEIVTVTAEDDSDTVVLDIQVWGTLPVQPKWGIESDISPPFASWPMSYEKREFNEYLMVLKFFNWHGPALIEHSEAEDGTVSIRVLRGRAFYLDDVATGDLTKVYFDSALRRAPRGLNLIDYAFAVKSFDFTLPTPAAPTDLTATMLDPLVLEVELYLTGSPLADVYSIERKIDIEGTYEEIAVVATFPWVDTDILFDTTYYYRVKALSEEFGNSPYSEEAFVITPSSPLLLTEDGDFLTTEDGDPIS
jgi:hypothetical protein